MKKTKIYCLKDLNNNVRYIGKTIRSLKERLSSHISQTKHQHQKNHRTNWINSCLNDGYIPEIELIVEVDGDGSIEEMLIINLCRQFGINLVNSTDGGDGTVGRKMSSDQLQKHILINSDGRHRGSNNVMYGKKHTEATKEKIRQKRLGSKASEETKRKISVAGIGRKCSKESLVKMANTRKLKKFVCNETGKEYLFVIDAARELDIKHSNNIVDCLKLRRKSARGYTFKYVSTENQSSNTGNNKGRSK